MNARRKLWGMITALVLLALGPVGAALAQQVKVTSADPASTTQGTTGLDVTIAGSGFDASAAVKFLVTGTADSDEIEVTNVVYVNSKKLVAKINARDEATVAKYDIEVTLSSGRKGKGTTLFTVISKSNDPCIAAVGFPAFMYRTVTGESKVYLADQTGACSRFLASGFSTAFARLSYPVKDDLGQPTNRGRVLWLGMLTSGASPDTYNKYYAMDFAVNGTSVVPGPPYLIADLGPSPEQGGQRACCMLELDASGRDAYLPITVQRPEGYVDQIFKVRLPVNLAEFVPQDTTQRATAFEHALYASVPTHPQQWTAQIVINAAGDLLYVVQRDYNGGSPTDRLLRIDLDEDLVDTGGATEVSVLLDPARWDVAADQSDAGSDRLALTLYSPADGCSYLTIMNGRTGTILNEGTKWPAERVTWAAGKVLSLPFGRRCRANIDSIAEIDPLTGATRTIIGNGSNPEGR